MTAPDSAIDGPPPPRPRSWWARNWMWVVPVGCLSPLAICGGLIALVLVVVFGALRSSDVYNEALSRAKANERVRGVLGEPITAGYLPSGKIEINGAAGKANLEIPIAGPKKSATIYVVATKAAGKWEYSTLEVAPKGAPDAERIDLLAGPAK